jgi:hypothetical protein
MDDELFKQKLSEVADWRIPQTLTSTATGEAKRGRGRPSKEQLYQAQHEETFLDEFGGVNPTFPPQLLKVKCSAETCGDCGKVCEQGRRKENKLYDGNGKKHWRERCINCGMIKNPYTGEFDLSPAKSSQIWNNFLRDTKGVYNSKGNISKQQGMIKIYPDSKPEE